MRECHSGFDAFRGRVDGFLERRLRHLPVAARELQNADIREERALSGIGLDCRIQPVHGAIHVVESGERVAQQRQAARVPRRQSKHLLCTSFGVGELVAEQEQGARLQLGVDVVRQGICRADVFAVRVLRVAVARVEVAQLDAGFSQLGIHLQRGAVFDDGAGEIVLGFVICSALQMHGGRLAAASRRERDRRRQRKPTEARLFRHGPVIARFRPPQR